MVCVAAGREPGRSGMNASVCVESAPSPHSFVPDAQNAYQYRQALGRFGTGVTIVTVQAEYGPVGLTVNSFASVSLDPPLILWSIANSSGRRPVFEHADRFAVNVLHKDQAELAGQFSRCADDFSPHLWAQDGQSTSAPVLSDALACFECSRRIVYDGDDHTIIVGRVEKATLNEGEPLLFFNGQFGSFGA